MIPGFRTGKPWKVMIALLWYALSFSGFVYGAYVGAAILLVAWITPLFVASVYDAVLKGEKEKLYTIPVFITVIGISVVLLAVDKHQKIKTATADVAVAEIGENVSYSEQDLILEPSYSEKVYITKSGSKYHTENCRFIKDKQAVPISVSDAENGGKTPCSVCLK